MSNSSVFKWRLKVLRNSADLQLYDSEFQTEGALTLKHVPGRYSRHSFPLSFPVSCTTATQYCTASMTVFFNGFNQSRLLLPGWSLGQVDVNTAHVLQLYWLTAPAERIQFKLAVLVYKCLHRTAPSYLADESKCSADFEARRRLHSTSSSSLTVRRTRLSTVGDQAFPVAAARTWNSLSQHVTSAPSMFVFRGRLKAFLFRRSFPWLVTSTFVAPTQWLSSFSDT